MTAPFDTLRNFGGEDVTRQPRDGTPTAMRLRLPPMLMPLLLTAACRATPPTAPDPGRLDAVARRYVILGLGLGAHDPAYVDAYYGPDSLRAAAKAESLTVGRSGRRPSR